MMAYAAKMRYYEGDDMDRVVVPPAVQDGAQELVLVTHDESTFYSNDSTSHAWLAQNEHILRKKTMGGSIMVSEFLCPCHGRLQVHPDDPMYSSLEHKQATAIIFPGQQRDGYWKSEDMLEQLKTKAIPLFEALHPGMKGMYQKDHAYICI